MPSLQKLKRRRATQSKGLVNGESLWMSLVKSLDNLYQAQENHQRITTTIVGQLETRNSRLIAESLEILDFERAYCLTGVFKDTESQVGTLVADLVKGMWAQQRREIE
jgi:hypothetical protein